MIKQDDIVELTAEKLLYKGDALCRYDNLPVFLKGAVPGDVVKARILRLNKNFARAKITEIITPSKKRIKPLCPLFNPCGACCHQNVEYDFLVEQKNEILKEFFKSFPNVEFKPFIKAEKLVNYRCKTNYAISETRVSKRLLAGYYKEMSHEVVNIKFCPIQPPVIDDITAFIRDEKPFDAYIEKKNKGMLKHILLRTSSSTNKILLTLVLNKDFEFFDKIKPETLEFAKKISAKFPQIAGVSVNFNPNRTNKITGEKWATILGEESIIQHLKDASGKEFSYKFGPESFFQVNPYMAEKLFSCVKELVPDGSTLLDAYGGVGAISVFLSDKVRKITLVEEVESAVIDAKTNFKMNSCTSYEVFLGDAKERFREFLKQKKSFDVAILDPPRKGSDKEALEIISKLAKTVIYVSCNPSTLARDAKILEHEGYILKSVRGVDMFPFTYHIESVAYFGRREEK